MTKIIGSHFKNNGLPATGLNPIISIWEITETVDSLLVSADAMTEVSNGFYKYVFTGYDPNKNYFFLADGGASLPDAERYQEASNANPQSEIWDAKTINHLETGSTGLALNQVNSDVQTLRIDTTDALDLIEIILKYQANRTKVDKNNKTLTVYDDDGTTPIRIFDLLDENGISSVDSVFERNPK